MLKSKVLKYLNVRHTVHCELKFKVLFNVLVSLNSKHETKLQSVEMTVRLLEIINVLILIGLTLGCGSQQSDNQPSPILDELRKPFTWILDKWHQYNAPEFKRCIRHYSKTVNLVSQPLPYLIPTDHDTHFLEDKKCSCQDVPGECFVGEGPCTEDSQCQKVSQTCLYQSEHQNTRVLINLLCHT